MISSPTGFILLVITSLLIFLGFARATLDRMRLTDTTTFILLVLLIIAHFMPIIGISQYLGLHLGALIPLGVIVYLLLTTSGAESLRAILITIATAVLLLATDRIFPMSPDRFIFNIDPIYMPGILAGIISYIGTRSRRSAFIAGIGSVLLLDIYSAFTNLFLKIPSQVIIAGGGVFDALIINAILAVVIAEVIGEIRERIHRGPAKLPEQGGEDID